MGGGGVLVETGGLFERGNLLAKTMVSVVPRLEYKMEKFKLKVMQPRIKNKCEPVDE